MRHLRYFLILVALFMLAAGCGSPAPTPEPTAEKKSAVAAQAVKQDKEAKAEEREQYRAEIRARELAMAKDAIARFRGRGRGEDWMAVVKSGPSGPLAELCTRVEGLSDLHVFVFERLDVQHKDRAPIYWQEVGVERAELWKEFVAASKKAATALLAVHKRPHAERSTDCGRGEGLWRFDEPGQAMQRLVWVMENAKLSPVSLGTTAEAMRTVLIADYRAYIAWYRKMIARGEASRSDGGGIIAAAVRDAEQLWAIPRAQLGLTAEELAFLK